MEWTREQRYLPYADWDAQTLLQLQAQAAQSQYQLHYHIHPQSGLLNDPNGFSYFNGEWHVFYQSYPFGPVHGLKSWMHLTSSDLVHWENQGLALAPDTPYDSHGAYSGSAMVVDNQLMLMYTGNHRDENWVRTPYQLGAMMAPDGTITKLPAPLITPPDHVTEHFRDPQLIKRGDTYYAIIGAQDKQTLTGQVAVYSSPDLHEWHDQGYLQFSKDDMGYMIECPNLVWVDGRPVLIFCPQGLAQEVQHYANIYPNMYLIGDDCDLTTPAITNATTPTNLDDGFDVYASQAFNAPDGNTYMISWVGLPDCTYPTDEEGWANCLSQVKELHVTPTGELIQQPVTAMKGLRRTKQALNGAISREITPLIADAGNQYELHLHFESSTQGTVFLAGNADCTHAIQLRFDTTTGRLTLDRGQAGKAVNPEYGTTRSIALPANAPLDLDIFIDASLGEIFINGGRHVMTFRFFQEQAATTVALTGDGHFDGEYWPLAL